MEEEVKAIKMLVLSTNELIISEISEVAAEFGDPNCRLVNPYKFIKRFLTNTKLFNTIN